MSPTVLASRLGLLDKSRSGAFPRAISYDELIDLAVKCYWRRRSIVSQQKTVVSAWENGASQKGAPATCDRPGAGRPDRGRQ